MFWARLRPALLGLAALLAPVPAVGQAVVTSPGPDSVDVTVYRDLSRRPDEPFNLRWLNGFALISETRRISLPAGEAEIRFEGVAGGILPQSAIVTGFPDGIVERNRDAYLLSPRTLIDRSLGLRVHLRRTSLATGAVREHEAVARSGAEGAVVLQTEDGIEALRCTGIPETIIHDGVPPGLSARPTLSVRTRSRAPIEAEITLSYLAAGLDWRADYVATLAPGGERLALFAWLTLANGDETGFADADTQAVAGRLNRRDIRVPPPEGGPLGLRCWPEGRTSDIAQEEMIAVTGSRIASMSAVSYAPPPPPPPPPVAGAPVAEMMAEQENLGDLKLYRIPEPVTVAAQSQKQIALLQRPEVEVQTVYRQRLLMADSVQSAEAHRFLVSRNRSEEGLGLPLPAGRLMLFSGDGPRPILLGEGMVRDLAVGEEVEIDLGPAPGIRTDLRLVGAEKKGDRLEYELVVSNDRSYPIRFEGEIEASGRRVRSSTRLSRRNGRPLWQVLVPANGTATLRYRILR